MTKWICQLDSQEYESEEAAQNATLDYIDICDFEQIVGENGAITFADIIKELQRLDSPLYYNLLEQAQERVFRDYFYEVADDED